MPRIGGVALTVPDDTKLYLGAGSDAHLEYDEDGTDELIISGAHGGIDILIPDNDAAALEIKEGTTTYMTVATTNSQEGVSFGKRLIMLDDTAIAFGTGQDATIEYDENGTDTVLYAGASLRISDDVKIEFGTGGDGSIMYGDPGGGDEFVITLGSDGGGIQLPDNDGAAFEIREAGNTYVRFNTANTYSDWRAIKPLSILDDVALNIGTPAPGGAPGSIEYDANGTQELVVSLPPAGMSVGTGFHRIATNLSITKAHSGDDTVANQLFMINGSQPVKIPNDAIITRIVVVAHTLSNLGTAVYNIQISPASGTSADSDVISGTELLGAGGSGTADSDGGSASDITMSSGGTLKKVWYNDTIVKTTADSYLFVANAGTGNGTTDPATGTLTIIIEYYGMD